MVHLIHAALSTVLQSQKIRCPHRMIVMALVRLWRWSIKSFPPHCRAIGGTSAGALAAVLLAGLRPKPDAPAGTALLESLLQMPVPKFKDGAGLDKAVGDCLIGLATGTHTSHLKWLLLPLFPVALVCPWSSQCCSLGGGRKPWCWMGWDGHAHASAVDGHQRLLLNQAALPTPLPRPGSWPRLASTQAPCWRSGYMGSWRRRAPARSAP